MERRPALSVPWLAVLLLAAAQLAPSITRAADALVVVVRADSPIRSLELIEVRKAFIGLSVSVDGRPIRPLINASHESLRSAFLQHVVGLSEQMYQRRMLTLALQQGLAAPSVFDNQEQLLQTLNSTPYSITYMWQSAAERLGNLRIIRTLWRG